ncbi:MAG: amidohydrolase family protein [Bryobacterales bacterium]|nr:amidohydrolase family protein [Bryobacterales bacterium]
MRRRVFLNSCLAAPLAARPGRGYRIWDLHCHFSGFPGGSPEQQTDSLIRFADRMQVERWILSNPLHADPTPEQFRAANDAVLRAIAHSPGRTLGLVYLNPNHLEASLREFDRCVRDGPMIGVKLWIAKHCSAPELDPIVERATRHQAIVFQHTYLKNQGNLPGESTPADLAELARRHPNARLILGHTGADWERGIRSVRDLKHVTVDLAGSDPTAGFTEMAVRELGAERVLYGSDAGGRSFASQLAKVLGAAIPEQAKSGILGGNLRRLLAPVMQAKGMRQ